MVSIARHFGEQLKSDERILGDSDFVEEVLSASNERLEDASIYHQKGIDLMWLAQRVGELLQIELEEALKSGKKAITVPHGTGYRMVPGVDKWIPRGMFAAYPKEPNPHDRGHLSRDPEVQRSPNIFPADKDQFRFFSILDIVRSAPPSRSTRFASPGMPRTQR